MNGIELKVRGRKLRFSSNMTTDDGGGYVRIGMRRTCDEIPYFFATVSVLYSRLEAQTLTKCYLF